MSIKKAIDICKCYDELKTMRTELSNLTKDPIITCCMFEHIYSIQDTIIESLCDGNMNMKRKDTIMYYLENNNAIELVSYLL